MYTHRPLLEPSRAVTAISWRIIKAHDLAHTITITLNCAYKNNTLKNHHHIFTVYLVAEKLLPKVWYNFSIDLLHWHACALCAL